LALFVLGQRSNKNGCSHAYYYTTLPITSGGFALEKSCHLKMPLKMLSKMTRSGIFRGIIWKCL
jgi:hypothetical protein